MNENDIKALIDKQKKFFAAGRTLDISYRLRALKRLKDAINSSLDEIHAAIRKDLGKSAFESYMCETGLALSEISFMLKHTRRYSREHRVATPLAHFASRSFVKPSPYGTVLIMSPWNYPFLLTVDPLADAIAAGNTVIIKPSAYSPASSAELSRLIAECFPPEYVAVITGGREENKALLKQNFDYIFFTGSQAVGREVMRNAAESLTPVSLELGGKSPCIIDASANISLAARRVVFGKYLNCGQTCVAPDYIYCHASVKERFIEAVKKEIARQFGGEPLASPDYGKIINAAHFERVSGLIDPEKVVCGGGCKRETLQIAPTVMDGVTRSDRVMQEEIFGPIMPIMTYTDINAVIDDVNSQPHPLALYIFASDKKTIRRVTGACSFGGGCVNDTIIHLATSNMGFGGVGASGIGSYHGKAGFDAFSHSKSIVDKKTWLDLPMRYQPYKKLNGKLIHMFLK
ncbi:MAG: aldehyde dehydrogenase [Butyrivibrio sp.]|nr:aldehyde dehydrogenase [Butyrivibrio sp.]